MWSWLEMSLEVKSRCCPGLRSPESLTEAGSLSFQVAPWQCGQGSADRGSSPVPSPDALAAAHPHGGRGELPCVLSVSQISSYSMGEELTQIRSQEAKVVGAILEAAHHRR